MKRQQGLKVAYRKISHAERIAMIYQHSVHKKPIRRISMEMDISYNSVRSIIQTYEKTGRTNKLKYV